MSPNPCPPVELLRQFLLKKYQARTDNSAMYMICIPYISQYTGPIFLLEVNNQIAAINVSQLLSSDLLLTRAISITLKMADLFIIMLILNRFTWSLN